MIRRTRTLAICLGLAVCLASVGCKKAVKDKAPTEETFTEPTAEEPEARTEVADADLRAAILALQRVHFGFDSSDLTEDSRNALTEAAEKLAPQAAVHLYVEGHADSAGETEYNLTLGEKRAKAVAEYLKKMGVAGERLHVVSYGEEVPLRKGESSDAMAANRRVDFKLMRGEIELVLEDATPIQ